MDTHMATARAWAAEVFPPHLGVRVTFIDHVDHVVVVSEDADGFTFATRIDSDGIHDLGER